jgi:adenylate cyclase
VATWVCSACSAENPEGTRFCGQCGTAADAPWVCSACTAENAPGSKFCGQCGAPAGSTATAKQTEQAGADVAEALKQFVASPVAERLLEGGGMIPGERRLITSLFADVSGFTPLSETLDPEELTEVIDPLISTLSGVVGRYEGVVDKYAGDAILALFGAPISHEDDAERAVHVALGMHSELERLKQELPHGEILSLHIGINTGHAIARVQGSEVRLDYNVLGDAVNLAQRLESVAPSGETYVSESTYKLTKDRFEYEFAGDQTLKGKTEPVPAWRVIGVKTRVERQRRRLVGRELEVTTLTGALDEAARGRGAVVVVAGEPGVGKSRLKDEVEDLARERDVRWLATRCLSYGSALAYWPLSELLRSHPEVVDAARDEHRPFIARLLGEAAPEIASLEPEAFRRGLHDAVNSVVATLAESEPIVIAVEDAHWADPSTVALTGELARLCEEKPFVLYLSTRPEGLPGIRRLLRGALEIKLGPLGEDSVWSFMTSLLGGEPPPGLAATITERTGGNPLFVEELVASLLETEAIVRDGDTWTMQPGWDAVELPTTIETVLAARIDLLSRPTTMLLQSAAVIGRRMRVELLEAVAADIADVHSRVDELVEKGFLEVAGEDGGAEVVIFHHALILDAAYARLLRKTRRAMHRRVGEVGEQLYGVSDENIDLLARHYYLGQVADKAVPFLVRAGERDKRLFANDEAILHFSRASELAPNDPEIKLQLADLQELVGNYDEALRLYADVRDATNDVRAWRGIAATQRKRGEYGEALETIDRAFRTDALKDEDLTPLWSEQGRSLDVSGRTREAIDVLEAGLEAANGRRDGSVGELLFVLAGARTIHGDFEAALANALEAQRIFEEHDDFRRLASTMRVIGDADRSLGRLNDAAVALRHGLELAERVGNAEEIGGCLINLGLVEFERGAVAEAIACDRRAIEEFERIGHGSGRAISYANLATHLVEAGELDEALACCERAVEIARPIGYTTTIADADQTLASIYLRKGDFRGAAERAEQAAMLFLEVGAVPYAAQALGLAAEAWQRGGDDERARETVVRARSLA